MEGKQSTGVNKGKSTCLDFVTSGILKFKVGCLEANSLEQLAEAEENLWNEGEFIKAFI